MKKVFFAAILVLFLAACTNQQGAPANDADNQRNNVSKVSDHPSRNGEHINNPDIIPSETGEKVRTTNRDGQTYPGVGQNIYSSIGTSGIHEGGVSSYFESILKGEGIDGVSVFVVDDAVILARNKAENTNHKYDNMQNQLLSGDKGESGKGQLEGVKPDGQQNHDNLHQAKQKMNEMFNGHVTILTVTQDGALDVIDGIKKSVENKQYSQASQQLLKLLNMTK